MARHTYRTFAAETPNGPGAELLEAAWRAETTARFSRSRLLALYLAAGRRGQVTALINAGSMTLHGDGCRPSAKRARRLWREAWRMERDAIAAWNLGLSYERLGHRRDAMRWYRLGANDGLVSAMEQLAWLLGSGRRAAQVESVGWLLHLEAMKALRPVGAYNLALAFEFGRGARMNLRRAMALYRRAARGGDANAQVALAYNLLNGIGVRPNRRAALRWYRRAAKAGHLSAHFSLGQLLSDNQARAHLQFAARRGHERARALLRERGRAKTTAPSPR